MNSFISLREKFRGEERTTHYKFNEGDNTEGRAIKFVERLKNRGINAKRVETGKNTYTVTVQSKNDGHHKLANTIYNG